MVLEELITPLKAEAHPAIMLVFGALYASLGLFLGMWIFREHTSLIMVFLTTMAAIPLVYNIIKLEEKKDLSDLNERNLLKEHSRALTVFMYYFIGATLAYAFWYSLLPSGLASSLFEVQTKTITQIRSNVTGNAYVTFKVFTDILSNNLKVLIFCILFSFLYGVGAIFILTWNASVIGVAIGDTIKIALYQTGDTIKSGFSPQYISAITYGIFRYSLHGIPEIMSYFVAGLAGGIISVAAIRHDFGTKMFEKIVMDSSVLLLLSLFLVVTAAFLEVYVTPMLF
jgi:uncharacterized membrane protein SpoIIM required for sporulation